MVAFDNKDFQVIKKKIDSSIAERTVLRKQLKDETDNNIYHKERLLGAEKARIRIQLVARKTQENLRYHIENIVSLALSAVFPDPPEFCAEFVTKRNQPECNLMFVENGQEYKPIDGSGGGPLDVASFALRTTFWSLNKNRRTLILDEPFKYVSPDLQSKVSDMLRLVSDKLELQIIMVSHAEDINTSADKTFQVVKEKGESKIIEKN